MFLFCYIWLDISFLIFFIMFMDTVEIYLFRNNLYSISIKKIKW